MKNKYLNNLVKILKEKTKIPEPGTMHDQKQDLSNINFDKAYAEWRNLPTEEMLHYGRELYILSTEFRKKMDNDEESKIKLANFRGIKISGLNSESTKKA